MSLLPLEKPRLTEGEGGPRGNAVELFVKPKRYSVPGRPAFTGTRHGPRVGVQPPSLSVFSSPSHNSDVPAAEPL